MSLLPALLPFFLSSAATLPPLERGLVVVRAPGVPPDVRISRHGEARYSSPPPDPRTSRIASIRFSSPPPHVRST